MDLKLVISNHQAKISSMYRLRCVSIEHLVKHDVVDRLQQPSVNCVLRVNIRHISLIVLGFLSRDYNTFIKLF